MTDHPFSTKRLIPSAGSVLVVLLFLFLMISCKKESTTDTQPEIPVERNVLEPYNYVLGTHAISGSYQFTSENKLVEQAKKVREMGSNILKITLGKNSTDIYGINELVKSTKTMDLFSNNLPYRQVCDMDFRYIFFWVHTLTNVDWKKPINATDEKILYDEMYQFVTYILKRYDNTGKTTTERSPRPLICWPI
jgi:hypothetical protein